VQTTTTTTGNLLSPHNALVCRQEDFNNYVADQQDQNLAQQQYDNYSYDQQPQ
jgi:hypothetical protein